MKLSHYLALAALALPVLPLAAHAQTSQTYRFGEGQSTLQPAAAPQPATPAAQPQMQARRQAEARPTKRPKHKIKKHRRRITPRLSTQSIYSHP